MLVTRSSPGLFFREVKMKSLYVAAAAVCLTIPTASASAAVIDGLFNTGTDANNVALAGGNGVADPHYVIVSSTSPGFNNATPVTFLHPAYAPDDANSRWISLSATGTPGSNTTTYRLTFDLTGYDPLTAIITGMWGADNAGAMFLNGVATGNTVPGFNPLTSFTVNSGFVAGVNYLDFAVTDFGQPTALRVDDISGQASLLGTAVPEPSTWAMMLLGFGAVGYSVRRRRKTILPQVA